MTDTVKKSAYNSGDITLPGKAIFAAKDKYSALTHFIGFLLAIITAFVLLVSAGAKRLSLGALVSIAVYAFSNVALYGASAAYHAFYCSERVMKWLKRLDHFMIFVLIAGSYTPMCTLVLSGSSALTLLISVWSIAFLGLFLELFWVHRPKWVSAVVYVAMGWAAVFALPQLAQSMNILCMALLGTGGILYTVGAVIYALKLNIFNKKHPEFGSHEVFHLFVLGGSICHYIMVFLIVLAK